MKESRRIDQRIYIHPASTLVEAALDHSARILCETWKRAESNNQPCFVIAFGGRSSPHPWPDFQ